MAKKKIEIKYKKRISLGYHEDIKSGIKKQLTKVVTVTASSEEEANVKFALEKQKLLSNIAEIKVSLTMNQLKERYYEIKDSLKKNTIRSDEANWKRIQPFVGNKQVTEISSAMLLGFFQSMEAKGYSLSTVHNVYTVVKKYLNLAVEQEWLTKNTILKLKYTKYAKLPDANNDDSVEEAVLAFYKMFLAKEARTPFEIRLKTMLLLASDGCLRVGELMALSWSDIDLDEKSMFIRKTKHDYSKSDSGSLKVKSYDITLPKTKSSYRKVPLMNSTVECLKLHQSNCEKYLADNNLVNREGFLFFQTRNLPDRTKNHNKRHKDSVELNVIPQKNNTFNQSLVRIAKKNNLVQFRSHKIRKTFYSLRLRKMEDAVYANYVLGHGVNRSDQSYILGMYRNAKEKQLKWEDIFKEVVFVSSEIPEE